MPLHAAFISEHFRWREFACRGENCCGGAAPIAAEIPLRLELLRLEVNAPLIVNSGFRCPRYNASLPDSSPTSYHMRGLAVDIAAPSHLTARELANIAHRLRLFPGIIWYPRKNFVHFDLRQIPLFSPSK